jgi:PAS domain S-box-containing protein
MASTEERLSAKGGAECSTSLPSNMIGSNGPDATENELARQNSEFLNYALDNAALVAMTDVKGDIIYANQKFCDISGYTSNELIGSNHRILKSDIHDKSFFASMYRKIARGEIWHGEICNKKKNGTIYWVDTTIVPHASSKGKIDTYIAIRFDITQRKISKPLYVQGKTISALLRTLITLLEYQIGVNLITT